MWTKKIPAKSRAFKFFRIIKVLLLNKNSLKIPLKSNSASKNTRIFFCVLIIQSVKKRLHELMNVFHNQHNAETLNTFSSKWMRKQWRRGFSSKSIFENNFFCGISKTQEQWHAPKEIHSKHPRYTFVTSFLFWLF